MPGPTKYHRAKLKQQRTRCSSMAARRRAISLLAAASSTFAAACAAATSCLAACAAASSALAVASAYGARGEMQASMKIFQGRALAGRKGSLAAPK